MPVTATVTYRCGGCDATATAPEQVIRREFVSLSGRDHGVGSFVIEPVKIESVAPEGWVAYDPYTMCTYCPACWESIEAGAVAVRRHQAGTKPPMPEREAEMERDWFAAEYRQSTTACCPRQTIPDSCSCLEGCKCLCADCDCCRCPDCGRGECTGEDCYWPDEAGLR